MTIPRRKSILPISFMHDHLNAKLLVFEEPGDSFGAPTAGVKIVEPPLTEGAPGLPLCHALRVKSAEYWIEHGLPDEALRELERLPSKARNHPWALRVHSAAVNALLEMNGEAHVE